MIKKYLDFMNFFKNILNKYNKIRQKDFVKKIKS